MNLSLFFQCDLANLQKGEQIILWHQVTLDGRQSAQKATNSGKSWMFGHGIRTDSPGSGSNDGHKLMKLYHMKRLCWLPYTRSTIQQPKLAKKIWRQN